MARVAEKTCLNICANNKGADQPAGPRRLISAFVVRCSSFFFIESHRICHFRAIQPFDSSIDFLKAPEKCFNFKRKNNKERKTMALFSPFICNFDVTL